MYKKIYRRLLMVAFMLLALAFLTYTSPTQHAAQQDCQQCHDDCEAAYELCLEQGSHCEQSRTLCHNACFIMCSW
jgi:hypothetical protein